jgi:hypothetical protein
MLRSEFYDETFLALAMHCWLHMSGNRSLHEHAVRLSYYLVSISDEFHRHPLDLALRIVTETPSNEDIVNTALADDMLALTPSDPHAAHFRPNSLAREYMSQSLRSSSTWAVRIYSYCIFRGSSRLGVSLDDNAPKIRSLMTLDSFIIPDTSHLTNTIQNAALFEVMELLIGSSVDTSWRKL